MRRLTHDQVNEIRQTPGATVLLFITDRCPVGCAHCSVDSRPDSPRITDHALFAQITAELAADPQLTTVGISGGEPFVERRALTLAARSFADAGKDTVVYTSGVWAGTAHAPRWVHEVLDRCACIYLSTDSYHEAGTGPARFVNAARIIAEHQLPIVVQVVDEGGAVERAAGLLAEALGDDWARQAELIPTTGLAHGRGGDLFHHPARTAGRDLGRCDLVVSPVVRYDGRVTACCNETVLMGGGPAALRRDCADGAEVADAVAEFRRAPLFQALGAVGGGPLTRHPRFADLADRRFTDVCGLCWAMTRRSAPEELDHDPVLRTITLLGRREVTG